MLKIKKVLSIVLSVGMLMSMNTIAFAQNIQTFEEGSDEYEKNLKEIAMTQPFSYPESDNNSIDNDVRLARQRVDDEENYIVNLINAMEGQDITNITDWEYNLEWLRNNYEKLENLSNIEMNHINSYITAYEIVTMEQNMPKSKTNDGTAMLSDYSRTAAVDYAIEYYTDYNPDYPDWSYYGDCANFVSQAVHAGGKPMEGTHGTSESAQDFSNWFSNGTSTDTTEVSSTWRGADAFKHYWKSNAPQYETFTSFEGAYDYGFRGDAVSLLNDNGRAYHTLIIVGYDSGDLVYAAHTYDTKTGSLESVTDDFIIFGMY